MTESVHKFADGVSVYSDDLRTLGVKPRDYLEEDVEQALKQLSHKLQTGTTIVNLGACFGYYAVRFCLFFPEARVFAFEPDENNRRLLKKTLELNNVADRVEVFEEGLWDRAGVLSFYSAGAGSEICYGNVRWQRIKESLRNILTVLKIRDHIGPRITEIKCISLAEVLSRAGGNVDLLMADIQGAETYLDPETMQSVKYFIVSTHSAEIHSGLRREFITERELIFENPFTGTGDGTLIFGPIDGRL